MIDSSPPPAMHMSKKVCGGLTSTRERPCDLTIGDRGGPTITGSDTTRRPQCTSPGPDTRRQDTLRETAYQQIDARPSIPGCGRLRTAASSAKAVHVARRPCRASPAAPSGVTAPAARSSRRLDAPQGPTPPWKTTSAATQPRGTPPPSQSFPVYGCTHSAVQLCAHALEKKKERGESSKRAGLARTSAVQILHTTTRHLQRPEPAEKQAKWTKARI
ncbi:hypothetical protein NDU88_001617 [Pleurodeles waltl]|uniref:Uncharacterized protein n=1 Tax=Pleurodeles waltl TaxID=8319 RepID=A0AAV7U7I7_PLEWA|nr:hypothetical protein NDU88_001617 [Pleurodeles waltl]